MSKLARKARSRADHTELLAAITAAVIGLLFGFVVLLLSDPTQALDGFSALLTGAFSDGFAGLGTVLYYTTTYALCGLSVGFAGRTGVFNIGGAGQFILGGAAAAYVGVEWTFLPAGLHFLVAILVAMLVGAIWGAIIGLLKAFFNLSEVVIGILLNYIGVYIANMFVLEYFFDAPMSRSKPVAAGAMVPRFGLDKLFPHTAADAGVFITILVALLIWFIFKRTTFGYQITACGYNPDASDYAGINAKRNAILATAISGAISGLAGALFYLSPAKNYIAISDATPAQPMTGICASLLAMGNPIGILFSSLFISYITVGGFSMQLYGFVPEIVDIVTAAIIYCSAFVILISKLIRVVSQRAHSRRKVEG